MTKYWILNLFKHFKLYFLGHAFNQSTTSVFENKTMNRNSIDYGTSMEPRSQWSLMQTSLLSSCFVSMTMFSKYPLDQYLGSGWSCLCFIMFHTIYSFPVIYLQFRLFSRSPEGILVLFDRYVPIFNSKFLE